MRSESIVFEMLPPSLSDPAAASSRMTNAACIVEIAFAPMAGASYYSPQDPRHRQTGEYRAPDKDDDRATIPSVVVR